MPKVPSIGILKTTDGGVNWSATALTFERHELVGGFKLLRHPSDPLTMYACTTHGLYRTTDGWATMSTVISEQVVFDIEFHPTNNSILYVATNEDVLVYNSTNMTVDNTLNYGIADDALRIAIAVTPAEPDYLYISIGNFQTYNSLELSTNAGASANNVFDGNCELDGNILNYYYDDCEKGQAYYNFSLAVHPSIAPVVHVGGVFISESFDGGHSWNTTGSGFPYFGSDVHADVHALEYNPFTQQLIACTDGGVYVFDGNDDEWYPANYGLVITQYYHFDLLNLYPGFFMEIMGGAQDNGTQQGLLDGSIFGELTGGDGFNCHYGIIDNTSFVEYSEIQNGKLFRLQDGDGSLYPAEITPEETYIGDAEYPNGTWDTPFEMKSDNGNVLAAGYDKLYVSGGAGESWLEAWSIYSVPDATFHEDSRIMDIDWGNDMDHLAFVVQEEGEDEWEIWKSTTLFNGLLTQDYELYGWEHWDMFDIVANGDSNIFVSDVVFCPQIDENALIVTVSNYEDSVKVFLFDGEATWTNISFNLPNVPVLTATSDDYGIYVGTDIGVFYKYYDEDLWFYYGEGLPSVPVTDIQVEESIYGRFLFISTYGRGLWQTEAAAPNRITRWYVDASATGANDGTSWENAFKSFTLAQDIVLEGDSIWVAGGTYFATPNNANNAARSSSFTVDESNIKIFGGFEGWEEQIDERIAGENETILSGDNGVPGSPGDNLYHVFITSTADYTYFDRITFADGNANGSPVLDQDLGGGVWLAKDGGGSGKSTVFNQCTFRNNHTTGEGGGVYLHDHMSGELPVRFLDCVFELNSADKGGGLYVLADSDNNQYNADASILIENCSFLNNASTLLGGGIYLEATGNGEAELLFDSCLFVGNTATENGGALYQKIGGEAWMDNVFSNCTFTGNSSGEKGGAVYTYATADNTSANGEGTFDMYYEACSFHSNTSSEGGAVYESELTYASYNYAPATTHSTFHQCVFDSCSVTQYGGAIIIESAGNGALMKLDLTECSFTGNIATSHAGAVAVFGDNQVATELNATQCTFTGNDSNYGGAIGYNQSQGTNTLIITDCLFEQNTASNGGAVRMDSGAAVSFVCEMTNTTFNANHANGGSSSSFGGAVSQEGEGNFMGSYSNCVFNANQSNYRGGAVMVEPNDVVFVGCEFTDNVATSQGGAVYTYHAYANEHTSTYENCVFDNNSSNSDGGALHFVILTSDVLNVTLNDCQFTNNQSAEGGAVRFDGVGEEVDVDIYECAFFGNHTTTTGGALELLAFGTVDIHNSTFNNNSCATYGGSLDLSCFTDTLVMDISGCDFLNGNANHAGAIHIENDGSTSHIIGEISTCTFDYNEANLGSGAVLMELWDECNITLNQNTFTNNHSLHASHAGGALMAKSFSTTDTSFVNIHDCVFENNSAVGPAGALHFDSDGHLSSLVSNSTFENNSSGSHGGAIRARANGSDYVDVDIENCLFDNNISANRGGAVAFEVGATFAEVWGQINQCVIVNNEAAFGGAIHSYCPSASALSRLDVYNTTLANNHATTKCGGIYAQRTNGTLSGSTVNNILWGNTDADTETNEKQGYISGTALISMAHTCVQDGIPPVFLISNSNIFDNPEFVNPVDTYGTDNMLRTADDGFALQETSPCIDMAEESFSLAFDFANTARPQLNGYDIGAYESLYSTPEDCFGDLNADGVVNTSDLLLFMSAFSCNSDCGIADLNADGVVNTTDLLLFMSAFGNVCE
ncbi:MAG: hypothetical protein JNM00_04850 [Flavobacteriales bacterium]|nr:hypothetical protein [Flavobacteriales bacterium]